MWAFPFQLDLQWRRSPIQGGSLALTPKLGMGPLGFFWGPIRKITPMGPVFMVWAPLWGVDKTSKFQKTKNMDKTLNGSTKMHLVKAWLYKNVLLTERKVHIAKCQFFPKLLLSLIFRLCSLPFAGREEQKQMVSASPVSILGELQWAFGPHLRIRETHLGKARKYVFFCHEEMANTQGKLGSPKRKGVRASEPPCIVLTANTLSRLRRHCVAIRQDNPTKTSQSDESHSSYVHDVPPAALRKETQCIADLRDCDFLNKYFVIMSARRSFPGPFPSATLILRIFPCPVLWQTPFTRCHHPAH